MVQNLCLFRKSRVVKIKKDVKLGDSGLTCALLLNLNSIWHWMQNPKTNTIIKFTGNWLSWNQGDDEIDVDAIKWTKGNDDAESGARGGEEWSK